MMRAEMHCRLRSRSGSILVILMLSLSFLVVPLLMIGVQIGLYLIDRQRTQNAVEAACLIAANDLSRVVINDPYFGFVGLSNFPPIGKATIAADGEPLPVTGINTLVGTLRQNAIVARELQNARMAALVNEDRLRLDATIRLLNIALKDSMCTSSSKCSDVHGQKVEPLKNVIAFLKSNLPPNTQLETVRITNGWLSSGATTNVPIPQPERLAELKPAQVRGGFYQPFVDIPVGRCSFSFGGIGSSSRLVTPNGFRAADDKHICSIVRIECVVTRKGVPSMLPGMPSFSKLECASCCQPFTMPDLGPRGLMTIRFTGGSIAGMESWRDFLTGNFEDRQVTRYDAAGGDFPIDGEARLNPTSESPQADCSRTTAEQFAENLYYWLRNGHLTPRLDAILSMIDDPFRFGPVDIYAYEFSSSGNISRRIVARDPFPIGVTSDAQSSVVADTTVQGASPIIVFRNNVKNTSTSCGGKHAGQPLSGYPLNWCEIPEYGGDENLARRLNKGRLGTRLTLVDPNGAAPANLAINEETYNLFKTFDGKTLYLQPRRSFYSGGLALDIEIGGTKENGSSKLVTAMRNLRR